MPGLRDKARKSLQEGDAEPEAAASPTVVNVDAQIAELEAPAKARETELLREVNELRDALDAVDALRPLHRRLRERHPVGLLAAAHAACFSMAFSNNLAKAGHVAEQLDVRADVTFDKLDEGWTVISSHLTVHGRVPGVDEATFQQVAAKAKDGCPISRALKGNVALTVDAVLEAA